MVVRNLIMIVAAATLLPGLAACGTQPGGFSVSDTNEMTAYYEPSKSVPDYSARGATGLVSLGIRLF